MIFINTHSPLILTNSRKLALLIIGDNSPNMEAALMLDVYNCINCFLNDEGWQQTREAAGQVIQILPPQTDRTDDPGQRQHEPGCLATPRRRP